MIPNPYKDADRQSPGKAEQQAGEYLVMLFRLLRIRLYDRDDINAVRRVGVLLKRWTRRFTWRRTSH